MTPLSIYISARIKLNEEERGQLKKAYRDASEAEQPVALQELGTSGIRTVSAAVNTDIDKRIGMSRLVFMDVVNSRDTISVPMLLSLQKALDVEIVDKKRLQQSCTDYIKHIFNN